MKVLAIDPGKHFSAGAIFVNGVFEGCLWIDSKHPIFPSDVDVLVIEHPEHHVATNKGDVNDLLDLAFVVGFLFGSSQIQDQIKIYPSEWTGHVPKKVRHARILNDIDEKTLAKIKQCQGLMKDKLDAYALGLFALTRLR